MPIQFLATQGGGGQQIPFERRNAPTTTSAYNAPDSLRLRAYEEKWRFFAGSHWSFKREDGEPLVTLNYTRVVINKIATWLIGDGIVNKVPDALLDITKPALDEVWATAEGLLVLQDMALTGGVTGDVFMLTTYKDPTPTQVLINPNTRGKIRVQVLGSHQVFPIWDPLDKTNLLSVRIVTEVHDQRMDMSQDLFASNAGVNPAASQGARFAASKRRYVQVITADTIAEGWEDDPSTRETRPNVLGEIPLVHIANLSFPQEYFGLSDLDGLIDVQREFNEKATDISDIVNYHAAPVTIITGAKAKQLERGPRAVWSGLPADAKVFNLAPVADLGASHRYLELIRTALFDLSGIPEGSLGKIQSISNTSAAALQVQFQPLIEKIKLKAPGYQVGLQRVNYFILRLHQIYNDVDYPTDLCEHCGGRIVEFPALGIDGKPLLTWSGKPKKKRKCYLIDNETLDFKKPGDVEVNIKRKLSFGTETRLMPFSAVEKAHKTEGDSYWDPSPKKDLQAESDEKFEAQQAHMKTVQEHAEATVEHEHASGQAQAAMAGADASAMPAPPAPPPPPPAEKPEVKPEQLAPNDMDIPEEPETIRVTRRWWNPETQTFVEEDLGKQEVVPTGCKRPRYLNPFANIVVFRSPLPRDKEKDSNLYAQWQTNGWVSRHWVMNKLDEDINPAIMDKGIADDIPFLLSMKGQPTAGVAQTAGMAPPGDNNGAPLPPGPGPGRGNKFAPGDGLGGANPPPNGGVGSGV